MARETKRDAGEAASQPRAHPRVPTASAAQITAGQTEIRGLIQNIGVGGAFVQADVPASLAIDTGLRLRFRLTETAELTVFATVRWIQTAGEEDKPQGFGVRFSGLSVADTQAIETYVGQQRNAANQQPVQLHASQKYAVATEGNALFITLHGFLGPEESLGLFEAIDQQIERLEGQALFAYIDATDFAASPEESLPILKECLADLKKRTPSFGVMVGSSPAAMLQMRRLVRDAGVAESIACFRDEAEAKSFWNEIRDEAQEDDK